MSLHPTEGVSVDELFPGRVLTFDEVQRLGYKALTVGTEAAERYVSTPADQRTSVEADPELTQAPRAFWIAQERLPQPGYREAEA